jgi:hypothetical protein
MTVGLVIMWCITAFFIGIIVSNLIDVFVSWRELRKEEKERKRKQELIEMAKIAIGYNEIKNKK